jgi:hypothetical protein
LCLLCLQVPERSAYSGSRAVVLTQKHMRSIETGVSLCFQVPNLGSGGVVLPQQVMREDSKLCPLCLQVPRPAASSDSRGTESSPKLPPRKRSAQAGRSGRPVSMPAATSRENRLRRGRASSISIPAASSRQNGLTRGGATNLAKAAAVSRQNGLRQAGSTPSASQGKQIKVNGGKFYAPSGAGHARGLLAFDSNRTSSEPTALI